MNEDTLSILKWIVPKKEHHIVHTFTPKDDDYYSLLQSPNGIGGAYLCMNYATSLKFKTITAIEVFWSDDSTTWTMIQRLG